MKILIVGAGAIGSLFGALLSKQNEVLLLGRRPHVEAVMQHGLLITGKTTFHRAVPAIDNPREISMVPDIIILTVKSYDTGTAMDQVHELIHEGTVVISLQNGLGNIETIERFVKKDQIIAGVTTYGAIFSKPGEIVHTGIGRTFLGGLTRAHPRRVEDVVQMFSEAGITTEASDDIIRELWVKAIINSSINPLTAFFQCKNGYLAQNPVLKKIVEYVSEESTRVALQEGIQLNATGMLSQTMEVITETSDNYSSMVQSIQQKKRTEIDAINGYLLAKGEHHGLEMPLNTILVGLIRSIPLSE